MRRNELSFILSTDEAIKLGGFSIEPNHHSVDWSNTVPRHNLHVFGLVFDDGNYVVPLKYPMEAMRFNYLGQQLEVSRVYKATQFVSSRMLAVELLLGRNIIDGIEYDSINAAMDVLRHVIKHKTQDYDEATVTQYILAGATDPMQLVEWLESGKPASHFAASKPTWFTYWAKDSGLSEQNISDLIESVGEVTLERMIFDACQYRKTRNYAMKIEIPQHTRSVGIHVQDIMLRMLDEGYVETDNRRFPVFWLAYFCGFYEDAMSRYVDTGLDIFRVIAMVVRGFKHEDIMTFIDFPEIDLELMESTLEVRR